MALSLHLVIDEILDPAHPTAGHAAEELARALLATAPDGIEIVGLVSASPEPEYDELERRLPGLARLDKSALARRELTAAWRRGLAGQPKGMLHSPSLLAPLARHDRVNEPGTQAVVTMHDALVWTDPETITGRSLGWHRAMVKRAERHADALVVPSHAVADAVAEHGAFGDRVRVIPPAPAEGLAIPRDALERLRRLELPGVYALTFATANPRHQLAELLRALEPLDVPLVITGDTEPAIDAILDETGMPPERVLRIGRVDREDLAAVQAAASVFVQPSREEGFALGMLEAFELGTPVVSSDAPAFVEVAADAALTAERGPGFVEGLRQAVESVLADDDLAERLRTAGRDRAGAFTWPDAAEKIWQLHADL